MKSGYARTSTGGQTAVLQLWRSRRLGTLRAGDAPIIWRRGRLGWADKTAATGAALARLRSTRSS
jgi:hypothetical protein